MSGKTISVQVTTALMPSFYRDFSCLAEKCRYSCCGGWNIEFNKKDYLRLRRLKPTGILTKERLDAIRRVKDERKDSGIVYGEIQMDDANSCPFLTEAGLCSLQLTCGADELPKVCREFPRVVWDSPFAKEYILSTGCEKVLELLWDHPEGMDFIEEDLPNHEQYVMTSRGEGKDVYFGVIRSLCVDILQERTLPLCSRMIFLGIAAQALMELDWKDEDIGPWVQQIGAMLKAEGLKKNLDALPHNKQTFVAYNLNLLKMIQNKDPELYQQALEGVGGRADDSEIEFRMDDYEKTAQSMREKMGDIEYFLENLMVNVAMMLHFPVVSSKEGLWKSYVWMCSLYSLFRFVAVIVGGRTGSRDELNHAIAVVSRNFIHNFNAYKLLVEHMSKEESSSLAHMAILCAE